MSLGRFISLWTHPDYASEVVSEEELKGVEARLQTQLPTDYTSEILQFGLPRPNIELLNTIVDRQLDLRDVSDFLNPAEMISETEQWRDIGLPEELVAFASDCMGNLFCFPDAAANDGKAPVFFFDHDDQSVETGAPSFARWIEDFCSIAPH